MTSSRKWMWATLGLTLIVGMGFGVALDRLLLEREGYHRHGERGAKLLAKLTHELDLNSEQQAALEKTIAPNRDRARAFWSESRTALRHIAPEVSARHSCSIESGAAKEIRRDGGTRR